MLSFYGVGVTVTAQTVAVAEQLRHDFSYFLAQSSKGQTHLTIKQTSDTTPAHGWRAHFRASWIRIFRAPRGVRRVSYAGRGWLEYRHDVGSAEIFCSDPTLAFEICQSVILSFVGEALDKKGIHRVHGLGLDFDGSGAVLLAASGVGKSTLALGLLGKRLPNLLSDDTPLVSSKSHVLSFPQRIAVKELPKLIDASYVRTFRRIRHGEKFVISAEGFRDRIAPETTARWLVLTTRSGGTAPTIRPLKKRRVIWPLLRWLVIGHETPQMWELVLRLSVRDVFRKCRVVASRLRVAADLLARCQTFSLTLSNDRARNAEFVAHLPDFMRGGA